MQFSGLEVDVIPTQGHELAGSQAVAVGDQDGRGVPMAPAVFAGSLNELLDFPLGKVLARPNGRLTVTFTAIGACIPGAVLSIVSRNDGFKLLRFLQKCNSIDIGLQTVTEGKERRSTWVKSQVGASPGQCPLYPPTRNFADAVETSAKGQNRTKASALISAACCGVSGAFIQI